MKHDILSVGKMCDVDYNLTFHDKVCEIRINGSKEIIGRGTIIPRKVYILDEIEGEKCYVGKPTKIWIWNKRLGHLNFDNMVKISQTLAVEGLSNISKPTNRVCNSCQIGKQTRTKFKTREHSILRLIELAHTYLCGPTRTQTLQGERYFILFIDDYTRMV